jgi:superfamily I DNA and/or RNA helicase
MRNFYMMEALYQDIQNEIEEIKKQFVKDSYYARLFLIECAVNLHSKNIGELREKLFLIENALDPIKVVAYLQVGNSYVLTNYEKANKLFNKANELTPEKYKTQIKKSMNFNNILWDKIDQYIEDGDKSNKLFYYAKTGQIEKGLELSENINLYSYTEQQKGFHFFYMGLLLNDKSMFYKSVEHFNKCGEKFYKTLPILELKKAGESSYILDALSA